MTAPSGSLIRPNDPDVGGSAFDVSLPFLPFSALNGISNVNVGYRILGLDPTVGGGVALVIDELRLVPFLVTRPTFIDRLAFITTVAAGAGGLARCGIYRAQAAPPFLPGALVIDGGSLAVDSAAGARITNVVTMLQPGWYWAAYTAGVAAPTVRNLAGINGGWAGFEVVAGATTVNNQQGLTLVRAYAALTDLTSTPISSYVPAVNVALILGRVNA